LIINTSDYITQRVKTINKDDTKCVTVLNGIDTTHFYNASPIPRESLGISHSDFVIVYSGRLTKDKGIMQLIQATKRLKEIPHIKLLIIGASFYGKNKNTDPFIDKLKAEAAPIKEKVIFTGFVNYQHIPSYLKMADIAVVPSMWEEPFGLTVVEAMAAGLPLITTNSGGIPEICEGVATIVDRENIIENLVATILALYQHPEKRNAMSQAALKHAQLFSKERYAENFFKAISSV
jgi:Glycosyltransferase